MILCGKNAVEEVLRHKPELVEELYISEKLAGDKLIETLAAKSGLSVQVVSDEDIKRLSLGESSQGVVSKLKRISATKARRSCQ